MGYSSRARQTPKYDRETGLKLPAQPKSRSKSPAPKAATAVKLRRPESLIGLSKLPRETVAKPPPSPAGSTTASPNGPAGVANPHAFRLLPGYKGEKNVHGLIDCFPDCDNKSYGYGGFKKRRNFIVHLREIHGQDIGSYDRRGGRNKKRQGKRTLQEIGEGDMGEGSGLDTFGRGGGEDTDGGMESDWMVESSVQFLVFQDGTASFCRDAGVKEHPLPSAEKEVTLKHDHIDRDISEMQYEQWTDSEIKFEPYYLTQFDLMGVWLERKLGKQLDWWPLSPPVYPDKSGLTRMSWKCKCGSTLSSVVSNEVVGRYQRSHSSPRGSGSTTTAATRPSPMPIQPSTTPSSPAGPHSGGTRSPRTAKRLQRSFSIPAGYDSGGSGPSGSPVSSHLPRLPPSAFLARPGSMTLGRKDTASSTTTLVGGPGLNLGSYILCCIRKGLYKTVLVQMGGGTFKNDQEFFRNLRAEYRRVRGWRQWMSLSVVVQIKFVRFTQYYLNFVDCHESGVLPPADNPDYDYRPKPPRDPPAFPAAEFMHYFDSPECAGTATYCLDLMPKRVAGKLESGTRSEGWGLQPTEGLSFWKLMVLLLLVWLATLAFAVWWMVARPGDLQNAFVPAAYAASVVAIGVVLPELKVVYMK